MSCHNYTEGEVYECNKCGLEIKILQGYQECCEEHEPGECECTFQCCGKPLALKE